jgi:ADP-ribosylglycohydrolase
MSFDDLAYMIEQEIIQRKEEGCFINDVEKEFSKVKKKIDSDIFNSIYMKLDELEPDIDYPFKEPSDLPTIRMLRPEGFERADYDITERSLYDKIYGAWLGRLIGCLLGKPVEGWSKKKIYEYLDLAGAYPLEDYFPEVLPHPEEYLMRSERYRDSLKGKINYMPRDDDVDYTILNKHIIEEYGTGFSTKDVGHEWLTHFPYLSVYTAERIAYRNLVNGLEPPLTATHRNPFREWIGAQIRADMWGYIYPGNLEEAAELAYKDASLSHVKNGIYGEMFVSSMISSAFITEDVEEVIRKGLSQIPSKSRLADAIRDVLQWYREYNNWEDTWEKIMEKHNYHRVHTINNAAIVITGLLYGEGDFEKTITISVMGGLDTDCNGATAGSILGTILGEENIPKKWKEPLNDRVKSYVTGFNESRISKLARGTTEIAEKNLRRK